MAHDVFVSYSTQDKSVADAIVAHVEHAGIRCWFAPRDITPGTTWGEAIVGAIEGSRLMVVVLSAGSNRSQQVLREVERAVSSGVIVLPFRIEDIDPTGAMAYYLATEHWLDAATPPIEAHIERLEQTIRKLLIDGSTVVSAAPAVRPRGRWLPLLVGALGIAVVAAIVGIVALDGGDDSTTEAEADDDSTTAPVADDDTADASDDDGPMDETGVTLEVVGRRPTSRSPNGLAVAGDTVYLAAGDALTELDMADPTAPRVVAEHDVPNAADVAYDAGFAYVLQAPSSGGGTGPQGLTILDVATGAAIGSWSLEKSSVPGLELVGIDAEGGFVYVTSWNYVGIIDATDPARPELVWEWEPPDHTAQSCTIVVRGDTAYVGAGVVGLFVFDVSDPVAPRLLGRLDTPDWVVDIDADEAVVYLTLGDSGLATVDVSDPAAPVFAGILDLSSFVSQVSVDGGRAHVTHNLYEAVPGGSGQQTRVGGGVMTLDVSGPAAPRLLASYELDGPTDVGVGTDHLFVADEIQGVLVLAAAETG